MTGIHRRGALLAAPAKGVIASRPLNRRRHGHQNRLHIPPGFQAENRTPVMQQVEFHIAPTADQLMFALSLGPGFMHAFADNGGIGLQEGQPDIAGEGEIRRIFLGFRRFGLHDLLSLGVFHSTYR